MTVLPDSYYAPSLLPTTGKRHCFRRTMVRAVLVALAPWGVLMPGGVAAQVIPTGGTLQLCPNGAQGGAGRIWTHTGAVSSSACGGYFSFSLSGGGGAVGSNGSFRSTSLVQGYADGRLLLRGDTGVRIEGPTTFTHAANFGNNRITNLGNGTADTDAVNLRQLKAAVAGATGSDYIKVNPGTGANAGAAAATNTGSIAIGGHAVADAGGADSATGGAVAIGQGAKAQRSSVALGSNASAVAPAGAATALALGTASAADGNGASAVGANSLARGAATSAVGAGAQATAANATALGQAASATATNAVALGRGARATADGAVALGTGSVADEAQAVSVGNATLRRRITNVANGTAANDAVNVGQLNGALANKVDNEYIKIGSYSGNAAMPPARPAAASNYGVALGVGAVTSNWHGTSVGTLASSSYGGTAVGDSALAGASAGIRNASAFGTGARAEAADSVALGSTSIATAANAVALGAGSLADQANAVSVGNAGTGLQRRIVNMAAGTLSSGSTDAVNGSQLFATNERVGKLENGDFGLVSFDAARGSVNVATAKGGDRVNIAGTAGRRRLGGLANGMSDDEAVTIAQLKAAGALDPTSGTLLSVLTYDDASLATAKLAGVHGTVISNLANGQVAAGSMQAINGGQLFQALTDTASLLGGGASVGLQGAFVAPTYSIQNSAYHNVGDALGALDRKVSEIDQRVAGAGSARVGTLDAASSAGRPAVRTSSASASAAASTSATPTPSAVIGTGAVASGAGAVALGDGAVANADNSVALGKGSVADRPNSVSVGSAGNERQLTNVAEGTADTDGVNKGQLDRGVASANSYTDGKMGALNDSFEGLRGEVDGRLRNMDRRIDRQGAMSAAMLNMATSAAGVRTDNRVGVGVGFQGGESALSVGYQRALSDRATVTLGGALSGDDASVGFGAGFGW